MGGIGRGGGLVRKLATTGAKYTEGLRQRTENNAEERPRKSKRPPVADSISPVGTRYWSEAAGGGKHRNYGKRWSGDRGRRSRQIGLIDGRRETRSYKIVSPPEPRGRCTLSVAMARRKEKLTGMVRKCNDRDKV